jgi:hypothetical protein
MEPDEDEDFDYKHLHDELVDRAAEDHARLWHAGYRAGYEVGHADGINTTR